MITAARQLALNTSSLRLKTLRLLLLALLFYSGSGLANCCNIAQQTLPLTAAQDNLSSNIAPNTDHSVAKPSPCHGSAVQEEKVLAELSAAELTAANHSKTPAMTADSGHENCCADCVLVALPPLPTELSHHSAHSTLENLLVRFPSIIAPPAFRPPIVLHS